jgi:hypothetical protein
MTAVEALALAHAEGVKVSLAGDGFIRWQSRGELPPHVRDALKSTKPEIVALLRRYALDRTGALVGDDDLLRSVAELGFRIRRYGDQAALDDDTGHGRVPSRLVLYEFADRQREYGALLQALQPYRASEPFRSGSGPSPVCPICPL